MHGISFYAIKHSLKTTSRPNIDMIKNFIIMGHDIFLSWMAFLFLIILGG